MEKKKITVVMTCLVNENGECNDDQIVAFAKDHKVAKKVLKEAVFDTLERSSHKWELEVIRDDDYHVIMRLLDEGEPILTRWYYLDEIDFYWEE